MNQQLTSPSNISAASNLLHLNSSSCCLVSPSQSNFSSSLKDKLISFEQYKYDWHGGVSSKQQTNKQSLPLTLGIGKKKLTIEIDQTFQYQKSNENDQKSNNVKQKSKTRLNHRCISNSQISKQDELCSQINSSQISKLNAKISQLKGQIKILNQDNRQFLQQIQQKNLSIQNLRLELTTVACRLQQKQSQCKVYSKKYQILLQKLKISQNNLQKLKLQMKQKAQDYLSASLLNQIDQKMKQKDSKVKQLQKINEKLKNLNKDLINEIKNSQKKVRDLQKQIQTSLCSATQQNINRLKESSLKYKQKENTQRQNFINLKVQKQSSHSNGMKQKDNILIGNQGRKSLERKKNGMNSITSAGQLSQTKKAGSIKIVNSNSNTMLHKKMAHK